MKRIWSDDSCVLGVRNSGRVGEMMSFGLLTFVTFMSVVLKAGPEES